MIKFIDAQQMCAKTFAWFKSLFIRGSLRPPEKENLGEIVTFE